MTVVPQLALVVEDDQLQREVMVDLLSAENMDVIQCESAEAGELVLAKVGLELSVLVTDVTLAGTQTGLELAQFALEQFPKLRVVVVSAQDDLSIPAGACFLAQTVAAPRPLARSDALNSCATRIGNVLRGPRDLPPEGGCSDLPSVIAVVGARPAEWRRAGSLVCADARRRCRCIDTCTGFRQGKEM